RVAQLVREHREELVLSSVRLAQRALGPLAVGDVAREAARVLEAAVLPMDGRIDEDVARRAVLAEQARFVVDERLAAREASQHVVDRRLVGMELRDVLTDVFVARVAEHVALGLVAADHDAIRTPPVQADGGVLEELAELPLAALEARQMLARIVLPVA